jgi:hypothetical protein
MNKTLSAMAAPVTTQSLYNPVKTEWQPGDTVECSGVYRVRHGDDHLMYAGKSYPEEHQVICFTGQIFPACSRCGTRPRFTLAAHGEPIEQNEHFK